MTGDCARRRDAPDASGRLASFSIEGRGSRALPVRSDESGEMGLGVILRLEERLRLDVGRGWM